MERGLDFNNSNVQVLTLSELTSTIHENYSNGLPCGGIYHFDLIQWLLDELRQGGLKPEVVEIFAANNKDRYRPGVSIDEKISHEMGEHAFEAYTLRRIYANVKVCESEIDGIDMNMAVAYHQLGIQVAFGPMVRVCHNQTILGAQDIFTTQNISQCGNKLEVSKNVADMKGLISGYLASLGERTRDMMLMIKGMQNRAFLDLDCNNILCELMERRIRHDSSHALIHRPMDYPLSSAQINAAYERYLIEADSRKPIDNDDSGEWHMSWWDALNVFNVDLKPGRCVIPSIVGQSYGLGDVFCEEFRKNHL